MNRKVMWTNYDEYHRFWSVSAERTSTENFEACVWTIAIELDGKLMFDGEMILHHSGTPTLIDIVSDFLADFNKSGMRFVMTQNGYIYGNGDIRLSEAPKDESKPEVVDDAYEARLAEMTRISEESTAFHRKFLQQALELGCSAEQGHGLHGLICERVMNVHNEAFGRGVDEGHAECVKRIKLHQRILKSSDASEHMKEQARSMLVKMGVLEA